MPQKTNIEWTATYLPDGTIQKGYTSNPIYAINKETGKRGWFCVKVSPGCGHCYSETLNVGRFSNKLHYSATKLDMVQFVLNENELFKILRLNELLRRKNEKAKLFLGDMTDIFLDQIPDEFLDRIFSFAALCPNITFQILTKRAVRMREYFKESFPFLRSLDYWWKTSPAIANSLMVWATGFGGEVLPNVWLGVSVENQKAADERIPLLLETPAAVRFLSCEPLLSEIQLPLYYCCNCFEFTKTERVNSGKDWGCAVCGCYKTGGFKPTKTQGIDWVIAGGESGAKARSCNIDWMRSIVEQCKAAKVPVFVKQLGAMPVINYYDDLREEFLDNDEDWTPLNWDERDGQPPLHTIVRFPKKDKKGGDFEEFPDELKFREFPK